MRNILIGICFIACLSANAQRIPNQSVLSLSEIMKGNEFIGNQPENIRWNATGKSIYFDWNPNNEPGNTVYELTPFLKNPLSHVASMQTFFEYDPIQHAYPIAYYAQEGALIAYDKNAQKSSVIYQESEPVFNIQRVSNPSLVYFQKGNNLFCYDSRTGSIMQQSNFVAGSAVTSQQDSSFWMKEEHRLFQSIREQQAKKDWLEKQDKVRYHFPKKQYIAKEQISHIQVDPSTQYITFRLSTYPPEKETEVQHHVTGDGFATVVQARPKVANLEPTHRLGIYNKRLDSIYFVSFSGLSDIRKKPSYLNDTSVYTMDRKIITHSLKFNEKCEKALCDVRSCDNKDRWIVMIDLATATLTELDHQHDEAWIGGPGISSWDETEGTLAWLKDGNTLYFQSEESGFSQLYLYDINSKKKEQLTFGEWEVYDVQLSHDGKTFFITGNKTHPGNRDFYHYSIAKRTLIPILTNAGYHDVKVSPDEKTLAVRYSFTNKPWELYVAENTVNTSLNQLTHATTSAFQTYAWKKPNVLSFKASDGVAVYARLYTPSIARNKAAVIFVHGAGYLQNAHNYWSNYYREYMFHNLLVDKGFTVLDIDYRASEGYGRRYRTDIYRNMGGRDLQDQLDGKKFLIENYGIDSNRVGIYGGSYGGFITLMAMLKTPGEFPCGAALRSVTDWAHYNTEYTSNILNYPETDPEAYRRSSPIYYAENLKGKLLMLHGMVDDNVQFQDVVRLSERFIELGKENWDMAIFPVESHGFKKSYSWYDEYRRIYELFYTELILKQIK